MFLFHTSGTLRGEDAHFLPHAVQSWFSLLGFFGVAVFFVISGFLLFRPYSLAILEGRPIPKVIPFWKRRFFRIFPAYWVALAVAIYLLNQTNVVSIGQVLTTFGLAQNYRYRDQSLGLGVAWTLSIELAFYLTLPLFAWVVRRMTERLPDARSRLRVQLAALAVVATAGLGVRSWYLFDTPTGVPAAGTWFSALALRFWLPTYLDWFAFGMAMAVAISWLAIGGRLPKIIEIFGRLPALSWFVAAECWWLVVQLGLPLFSDTPGPSSTQDFFRWTLMGVAGAFFVLPAVFGLQDHGGIRRLLRSRVLVALGVISYGFYLWHLPVWIELEKWLPTGTPMLAQVGVALAVAVVVAAISWELIERPIIRWSTGSAPFSLFTGHTVAPRPDRALGEIPRARLTVALLIVVLAAGGLAVGALDLARHGAVGSPDNYRWRGGRADVWADFRGPDHPNLGATRTGQAWIPTAGAWSVTDHHAEVRGTGFVLVRVPAAHIRTTGGGLAFRCADAQNCWWIDPVPLFSTWNVHKIVDGHVTDVGNVGVVPPHPGARLAVHLHGDTIQIAIDGKLRRTIVDPALRDAVGVGLAQSVSTDASRWTDFEADR